MEITERYFEDFEIGENRRTLGRTITEADIVAHAGQTATSFPTIWTRFGAPLRTSSAAWRMAL